MDHATARDILVVTASAPAVLPGARVVAPAEALALYADGRATIVLVDVGAPEGEAALHALAPAIEARGGALIAWGGEPAGGYKAGATHWVAADGDLPLAIRFARRHVARVAVVDRRRDGPDAAPAVVAALGAMAGEGPITAVAIALSRLDLANAAFGRDAIDALLATAEARIAAALPGATVERLGGARFAVAVAGRLGRATAAMLGERLGAPFGPETTAQNGAVSLGVRIGIADQRPGDAPAALLGRALDALGGDRAEGGALRVATGAVPIDRLAVDLHRAIDRGEIALLFQPQVRIADERIVGVEALARWSHPELGPLGAADLFAAADRADLNIALSDHIQRLALARAAAWPPALSALRLSLNLTAADVARADFARTFLDRVDAAGFPRDRLTVEVTESELIADLRVAAGFLEALRTAGVRVAIDDFGTGYSSLAYLTALPLDYLKIDRALLAGIDGTERDRVVVRGTVAMARALGLTVIAEGVETAGQRRLLAGFGCELYQGFLCAGPLDEAALAQMMEP